MRIVAAVLLVVALSSGGVVYYKTNYSAEAPSNYKTATIKRGDLLSTISATGTVEPEEVVDVGAQVAGKVKSLGPDPRNQKKTIDYGSVVEEDTVLAYIDDAVYKAQVDQARASLLRSQADLLQMKAKLLQADEERKRAEYLRPKNAIAETDYILTVTTYQAAQANVAVGDAVIKQSEASLRLAETNLGYTVIKSPVKGVIVDRRVNIGQTVVASLNAPSMFLIAKDLSRMQVWASVNEADIGRIHPGIPVRFTVDAYPSDTFVGKVAQIRLNATMTQNVVTYTVVVETDNSNLKLLPYLTANLQFEIEQHKNVLKVPNAALRWKPRTQQMAPDVRADFSGKGGKEGGKKGRDEGAGKSSGDAQAAKAAQQREDRGRVWVKDGDYVRPCEVEIGASDGTETTITGAELKEDIEVVVGEVLAADSSGGDTTNPFAPKLFKKR